MLLGLSLVTGAHESDAPQRESAKLARLGYCLGMAFQIIDDILDFDGDTHAVGKPVASDLKSGLYTLPVIEAIHSDPTLEPALSEFVISGGDISDLVSRIRAAGGINRARAAAARYTERARSAASTLSNAELRTSLHWLVDRLLDRTY